MFQTDDLPILGEFVLLSVVYLLGKNLESADEVDELINTIKDKCVLQDLDENLVTDILQELSKAIKLIIKDITNDKDTPS